jgi:hypothetical protein
MVKPGVTVCITSFNRFDLLCQCLDTFFKFNTYQIEKILIIEDSGILSLKEKILKKYGDKVVLIFNELNIGQVKSIDKLYNLVCTEYIFHIEEDYFFYKKNFIEDSLLILENNININQVWIKGQTLQKNQIDYYLEPKTYEIEKIKYRMVKSPNCGNWCGFSFNAGLRRLLDYKKMFPQGYGIFHNSETPFLSESNCNTEALKFNYRACQLLEGYCDAVQGESTYK